MSRPQPDPEFEALLLHLRDARGFDFTGYKRSSLVRRVTRRMNQLGISDYGEYVEHLELQADEFTQLFNTILINVTSFFRDPEAWEHLREEVLPALVSAKGDSAPIRVWSAGCASGQEAYTLAMVFAEQMGVEQFRARVKIYATDVDDEELTTARTASYSAQEVADVAPELLERYFEQVGGRHVFRKDLRRSVIFGRNDLVRDAPISRIDMLLCRNTLMYFTAETQVRILGRFHFALADTGILFLGKAEMLLSHSVLFTPVDLQRRIFRKVSRPLPAGVGLAGGAALLDRSTGLVGLDLLRAETLLAGPLAQLVVTADGLIALVNRQIEHLFDVSSRDVGRPFRDLELSYRPVELRRHIEQAQLERRTVTLREVTVSRGSDIAYLEVRITPLIDNSSGILGVSVVFDDVTAARRLRDELEHTNLQLETAYEELQSTNEELETTNEELQSIIEELETTNEELQSTNEELETTNEELQSTNDELQSTNHELTDRTVELDETNGFLDTILGGLRAGIIVIGRDLRVQIWNRQAEELWGLRRSEAVGEHFLNLDIGLPMEDLRPMIRRTLGGEAHGSELALTAVNRRGRTIAVRVLGSPFGGGGGSSAAPRGVILMMEQSSTEGPAAVDGANHRDSERAR